MARGERPTAEGVGALLLVLGTIGLGIGVGLAWEPGWGIAAASLVMVVVGLLLSGE